MAPGEVADGWDIGTLDAKMADVAASCGSCCSSNNKGDHDHVA